MAVRHLAQTSISPARPRRWASRMRSISGELKISGRAVLLMLPAGAPPRLADNSLHRRIRAASGTIDGHVYSRRREESRSNGGRCALS